MDLSAGTLIASLFVSSIGFALFLYGKKQVRFPQLMVGIAMMTYPYFIAGPILMLGVGVGLIVLLAIALRSGR